MENRTNKEELERDNSIINSSSYTAHISATPFASLPATSSIYERQFLQLAGTLYSPTACNSTTGEWYHQKGLQGKIQAPVGSHQFARLPNAGRYARQILTPLACSQRNVVRSTAPGSRFRWLCSGFPPFVSTLSVV